MDKNRSKNAALGNIHPGDGYKLIGRGLKQTTGRYNYGVMNRMYPKVWEDTNIDFLQTPEALEKPIYAARSPIVFWLDKEAYIAADNGINDDSIDSVSKIINRYATGSFAIRRKFVKQAADIF